MFRLNIMGEFESAHYLRGYKGKCENMHGHNYKVELTVNAEDVMSDGLALDFVELKRLLKEITESLDHKILNDILYFKVRNPSAEMLAKFIYEKMSQSLPKTVTLDKVRIWENDRQWAEYFV
ncbi:MAG: 6-carboxytetrahydropterin synthase QueD [Spirochaetes bacterium]|nr:6-carboxytetrahydropterin synthase QueD [Spirochaetota bacterium]